MKPEERRSRVILRRFLWVEIPGLTIISALATITAIIPWLWTSLVLLLTAISLVWAWTSSKPIHIHSEVLAEESDEDVALETPASHDLLVAANDHARTLYGHDALSLVEVERWWGRNPWVITALRTKTGEYLGYFDILPLTVEGVKLIESGKFVEKDIGPEHILPAAQMKNARKLYLAGIAAKDAGTEIGRARASQLISGLTTYVRHYYGDKPRRIIAIGATEAGVRLLKSVGARVISSSHSRRDKHDLYEFVANEDLISSVRARSRKRGKIPKPYFKTAK